METLANGKKGTSQGCPGLHLDESTERNAFLYSTEIFESE